MQQLCQCIVFLFLFYLSFHRFDTISFIRTIAKVLVVFVFWLTLFYTSYEYMLNGVHRFSVTNTLNNFDSRLHSRFSFVSISIRVSNETFNTTSVYVSDTHSWFKKVHDEIVSLLSSLWFLQLLCVSVHMHKWIAIGFVYAFDRAKSSIIGKKYRHLFLYFSLSLELFICSINWWTK